MTAAETIRENDPDSTIGIISDEPHPLYSRVLLPHYLKKKISREKLFLRKIDDFSDKKIELRMNEEVSFLDCERKEVKLKGGAILGFNKLLVASGGRVKPWGKDGDQEFIYRLQTIDDADRLTEKLSSIKNSLVIGGSFISLEFLEIFTLNNIPSTLLLRDTHFLSRIFDFRGGEILRNNFEKYGIKMMAEDSVKEVEKKEGNLEIETASLQKISCDSIALGIGIDRNIEFLRDSGIELGERGIRTNQFLETNRAGIFAAGDTAEFFDIILGKHHVVGNWTNAFLQGKIAGLNMLGRHEEFKKVSGYSITNLGFQITALGECSSYHDSVIRLDAEKNQYERFCLQDGVLVGAALINRFEDKPHLANLIENKKNLENYREQLADFKFDIQNISIVN